MIIGGGKSPHLGGGREMEGGMELLPYISSWKLVVLNRLNHTEMTHSCNWILRHIFFQLIRSVFVLSYSGILISLGSVYVRGFWGVWLTSYCHHTTIRVSR